MRKREIVFAVAAGAMAAGGAALVLEASADPAPVAAAISGSGEAAYQLAGFDRITTTGPQNLVITLGEEFSVRSEGSPRGVSLLEPVVEDGKLTIGPRRGGDWGNWGNLEEVTFHVTLPRLTSIDVAGSGDVEIDRIEGESFEGSIAGSGELSIDSVTVDRLDFNIAGGGNVEAAGTAREAHIAIGGSGDVDASGLNSGAASVSIAGSGSVSLTVQDQADISIMGSGDVDIAGPARCSVTRFGSGEVRCEGGGNTDD